MDHTYPANRTYFAVLLAWILCVLSVGAFMPGAAAPAAPPASVSSVSEVQVADGMAPAPVIVEGSMADSSKNAFAYPEPVALTPNTALAIQLAGIPPEATPTVVLRPSSAFDVALSSGRLARFSR